MAGMLEREFMQQLASDLAALKSARQSGIERTKMGDLEVWFRSDEDLQKQIAALESRIASFQGVAPPPLNIVIRSQKGW